MDITAEQDLLAVDSITLEVPDPAAADAFHRAAFGLVPDLRTRAGAAPTSGFRGFVLSLVVPGPGVVERLVGAAREHGATVVKPVAKSFWGYGGVVRAPDGTIWKIATSARKDTGPATRTIDDVVLLLGVDDVRASKRFYADRGLPVARSFGGRYVEFAGSGSPVKLALLTRRALAKDAGVAVEGSGSHRIVIGGTGGAFTDPDGFAWEAAADQQRQR